METTVFKAFIKKISDLPLEEMFITFLSKNPKIDDERVSLSETLRRGRTVHVVRLFYYGCEWRMEGFFDKQPNKTHAIDWFIEGGSTRTLGWAFAHVFPHVCAFLKNAVDLKLLDLSSSELIVEETKKLFKILSANRSIRKLKLNYCKLGAQDMGGLSQMLKGNTALKILTLRGNHLGFPAHNIKVLAEALMVNCSLTRLDLYGNKINSEGAKYLALALQNNSVLMSLDLEDNVLCQEGADWITRGLRQNNTLTSLKLCVSSLRSLVLEDEMEEEGQPLIPVSESLAYNCSLKSVDLRFDLQSLHSLGMWFNCRLTSLKLRVEYNHDFINPLSYSLLHNNSLRSLDIAGHCVGPERIKPLAKALMMNTTLTDLNLALTQLKEGGVAILMDALMHNTSMTSLNLASNEMTNKGIKCVATWLAKTGSIEHLNVHDNAISEAGARSLAKGLALNRSLTYLDMTSNQVSENGVKHLTKALEKNSSLLSWKFTGGFYKVDDRRVHFTPYPALNQYLETLLENNDVLSNITAAGRDPEATHFIKEKLIFNAERQKVAFIPPSKKEFRLYAFKLHAEQAKYAVKEAEKPAGQPAVQDSLAVDIPPIVEFFASPMFDAHVVEKIFYFRGK